jgi:hypothetical protein
MSDEHSTGKRWGIEEYLSIYERAQEAAFHTDAVLWEIAAITWGANTVLLGFVLEAIEKGHAIPFTVLVSIVGMVLTAFVYRVCDVARVSKKIGYGICQDIEKHPWFPAEVKLHTKIHEWYPAGMGRKWISVISVLFGVAWLSVFVYALWLLLCRAVTR